MFRERNKNARLFESRRRGRPTTQDFGLNDFFRAYVEDRLAESVANGVGFVPADRKREAILAAMEQAAKDAGKTYKKMVSRAYHDSLFMARIAPVAMLFIPCRGGVSHRPDEYASPQWIGSGVHVLARTLATLSS